MVISDKAAVANALSSQMSLELTQEGRHRIWVLNVPFSDSVFNSRDSISQNILSAIISCIKDGAMTTLPIFRGVQSDKFDHVMNYGIDVIPTDSVIFAADIQKALEYGGPHPLILLLSQEHMRRSFERFPESTPVEVLNDARRRLGSEPNFDQECRTWHFSRLSIVDRRRMTDYEFAYCWHIPEDPFAALIAVLRFIPT